jgi:DNA repair exonuclease SbcCD nuclease subunit
MIIAGDLFDKIRLPKKDVLRVRQSLGNFAGKLVAVLPGNHDYFAPGSADMWDNFSQDTSGSVLLLKEQRPYPLNDFGIDAIIYPGPCTAKHSQKNTVDWIAGVPTDTTVKYHIGVAHGSIEGLSLDDAFKYYPMTLDRLLGMRRTCWIVGHSHVPWDDGTVFVPGTPEPDGFDCTHAGHAVIIEMLDGRVQKQRRITCGTYSWKTESFELAQNDDIDRSKERLETGQYKTSLLKLELTGNLNREDYARIPEIESCAVENVFELKDLTCRVHEKIGQAEIDAEFPQGSYPHILLSKLIANEKDADALQIAYGLLKEARK